MRSLPRSLKEPLLLTVFEGLRQREAAGLLGVSTRAIEMRVYGARVRLSRLVTSI
jgi:RNA polymerase sigma factor CnrH